MKPRQHNAPAEKIFKITISYQGLPAIDLILHRPEKPRVGEIRKWIHPHEGIDKRRYRIKVTEA